MRISRRYFLAMYSIAIIETIALYYLFGVQVAGDTADYLDAWNNLYYGKIDYYRTPVYPAIIGVSRFLICNRPYLLVVITQTIFYLISIYCFIKILCIYLSNKRVVAFFATLYAAFPIFLSWNITILTESLSLSGFVIFLYFFFQSLNTESLSYQSILLTLITISLLVFLRPSNSVLVLLILIIWFLQWIKCKTKRLYYTKGLLSALAVLICIHFYMFTYKQKYGIYSLSSISLINQYYMARQNGYVVPEAFEDDEIRNFVIKACKTDAADNSDLLFKESFGLFNRYCYKSDILKTGVYNSIKQQPQKWIKGYYKRLKKGMKNNYIFYSRIIPVSTFFSILGFSFHTLIYILIVFIIIIINKLKFGEWPILSITLFICVTITLLIISVGAQSEWGRLFLPLSPSVLLVLGKLYEFTGKRNVLN